MISEWTAGVQRREKIVALEDLPRIRERFFDKKIVHCHGAFDLVHIGQAVMGCGGTVD